MCGRINQPNLFNVTPGEMATIRTVKELEKQARFGYGKKWSKSIYPNARAETLLQHSPSPFFYTEYRTSRCVVPVVGFLEGPEREKLAKPYLISCQDNRIFYLAGLYEQATNSFAIITTVSNPITAAINHHRSPVMLYSDAIEDWLNAATEMEVIEHLLTSGYVEPEMQLAPLDANLVRSGKNKTAAAMQPIGPATIFD